MRLAQFFILQGAILAVLALAFAVMAWGTGRPWRVRRADSSTDLAFFYMQGMFTQLGQALTLAILAFSGLDADTVHDGRGPVAAWPLALQVMGAFVVWEFVIYWQHRLLHHGRLWHVHAVHHSSRGLDWLSTYRAHPIEILFYLIPMPILFGLGFSAAALTCISVFRIFHNAFVHADLPWRLGPLRYVLVSPVLHRWHHETSPAAAGKNFASALALYDYVFGTYYCPPAELPHHFGISDPVPAGFWRQLAFPLRRPA